MASDNNQQRVMDPRKRGYNPDYTAAKFPTPHISREKRAASRSPEGGQPVKKSVPAPAPGEGSSTPMHDSSRQSSVSNGTARPHMPPAAGSRRSSHQFPGVTGYVQSPDSLGSRYEDAQSGRSTPHVAPTAPMTGAPNESAPSPVFNMVMDFGNQIMRIGMMETSKQQANARLNRANTEFDNMKSHFGSFPAIKEQLTTAKAIAEREHKAIENQLNTQINTHKALVHGIAALIGHSAEVKPKSRGGSEHSNAAFSSEVGDVTTIKEKKEMMKDVAELKRKIQSQDSKHGQMQTEIRTSEEKLQAMEKYRQKMEVQMRVMEEKASRNEAELKGLKLDVKQEGKEPVVKRLKNLDRLVNNLSTQVNGDGRQPLQLRLSQLEQDQVNLEESLKAAKASSQLQAVPMAPTPQAVIDLEPMKQRLELMEKNMDAFEGQLQQTSDLVVDHVDAEMNKVNDELQTRADERVQDLQLVDVFSSETRTRLEDLQKAFETNQSSMQATASSIEASFKEVQQVLDKKIDKEFVTGSLTVLEQKVDAVRAAKFPTAAPPDTRSSNSPLPSPGGTQGRFQMSNGMPPPTTFASSRPNNGTPNSGPPQTNQYLFEAIAKLTNDVKYVKDKHDVLTRATQSLQTRFNNLTTDEICQTMLDQFSTVWPHAANYNQSVWDLQNNIGKLRHFIERVDAATSSAATTALEAKTMAEAASKDFGKATSHTTSAEIKNELRTLRSRVDILQDSAKIKFPLVDEQRKAMVQGGRDVLQVKEEQRLLKEKLAVIEQSMETLERKYLD
ncbi:hypothetical protein B0A50_05399 [Salinomyces thailandicus]|uniref:Uncharacterized protein n=1 Tax=Salinomyces thailandicus TaxID=706561 RepID=A0A4U0TTL1_9PEZI|nr:hypothetical protein B0A50_05399 [Salinomyces thailandica]